MKNKCFNVMLAIGFATAICPVTTALADGDIQSDSQQAIANFKNADSGLKTFIDNSAGYAVFASVGKGGFIVGGAHGKGVLYEHGAIVGITSMTQASIGAQAGGQSFSEIIVFQSPSAVSDFKAGKFEMSADVSAVIASEGASKSAKYKNGVAVFTLPKKGLMVQASIGGQKFNYEPLTPTGR